MKNTQNKNVWLNVLKVVGAIVTTLLSIIGGTEVYGQVVG